MPTISPLTEDDFPLVSQNLDEWWGGRNMAAMLPRLWFKDFSSTSFAVRGNDSKLIGFLVGYISQEDSSKSYVHFIGVDPRNRNEGLGKALYEAFATKAFELGANRIEAVTSPINQGSLAFHEAMGFMARQFDGSLAKPTQANNHKDFDGLREDRVLLTRTLPL
jgi:ribosomal protein S18 acetylase RimI-like enzyme